MSFRSRLSAAAVCAGMSLLPYMTHASDLDHARKEIRHVVVIFQENVSFDHYFGTYPKALNPEGEPAFIALPGTLKVDGYTDDLLNRNPNFLNEANQAGKTNPFRLGRDQVATSDQSHNYSAEQKAFNGGKMDSFPRWTGRADGPRVPGQHTGILATSGLTMGYFDGNTVTAYWNYAQHFAMSDNHWDVIFGPSTPGAINLISGQTNGAINDQNADGDLLPDGNGGFTMTGDPQPAGDVCSSTSDALAHLTGRNIGDMLTEAKVSWGWFQGGFDLTAVNDNGTTGCRRSTKSAYTQVLKRDYVPHHEPFQYYKSTANLKHERPSSVAMIGKNGDGANHQYDTHDFFDAIKAGNFPTVSYLKGSGFQDGHSGYSDPLDEQKFVSTVINFLQQQPEWDSTVVLIAYDDSDGWYDHKMGPIVNGSASAADFLHGTGRCGDPAKALPGVDPATKHAAGRCGFGPRLPLLAISPWAKSNFVDHTQTDQTSIMRLIEDLYLKGERLGGGSFDAQSGSIMNMFDFSKSKPQNTTRVILDTDNGTVSTAKAKAGK